MVILAASAAAPAEMISAANFDLSAATMQAPAPDADDNPFAKGAWTLQAYGSASFGDGDKGELYGGHIGVGYHFVDNLSINLEGLGLSVIAVRDDDGAAGGVDLLFRWHWARGENWSLYVDGGAGIQQATTNFPSDSHFNFRLLFGVGATFRLIDNLHLMGGARYLHISNAGTSEHNDGWDGAQAYLGLLIPF